MHAVIDRIGSSGLRRYSARQLSVFVVVGLCLALLGGMGAVRLLTTPTAVPYLLPVYDIEAVSGDCEASIANTGIGWVGAPQVPVPVDVDCDLLPDITVAVNLVDVEGPVHDPLATDSTTYEEFLADRAGRTIAPNVEINRYPLGPLAVLLGEDSPPVRVNVKFTVSDLEGTQDDTVVRFGYDTAEGGSIPTHFKALVRGLEDFFNPLEAVVDTKGGLQGGDAVPTWYEGPLQLIGGLERDGGQFDAELGVAYSPFPDVANVRYESDDDGHHIDYAHGVGEQILLGYGTAMPDGTFEQYVPGELPEVDVETTLDVLDHGDTLHAGADVDRLPRRLGIDIQTTEETGRFDYDATTDGRLPDVRVDVESVTDGQLLKADAIIEELPPEMHARWKLADGDVEALFSTVDPDAPGFDLDDIGEGPGIGAIEVSYANVESPTAFTPFVPAEQQFLNLQAVGGEQLLTGRIERIRGLRFSSSADGVDVISRVGDGALPLETNVELDDLPDIGLLTAGATIAPLPAEIDALLRPGDKDDASEPFRFVYEASSSTDIDATAELREPAAVGAVCGDVGTTCADLALRHVPAEIEVRIEEDGATGVGATTDVAVDMVRRPGAAEPDVFFDALVGKPDSSDDPDALAAAGPLLLDAHGELLGIPETVRIRFVEGADETLERLDVATCELDGTHSCPDDTDPIGRAEVVVRNFTEDQRDGAGIARPEATAPQFATFTAKGLEDPPTPDAQPVRFEASARVHDITEVRYANIEGLFGLRSVVGDDRDLEVLIDAENIFFADDPAVGPVDLEARALVQPLPAHIDLCLRESGKDLSLAHDVPFTDACESGDPFGDGSLDETPLTFAYDASRGFDVHADLSYTAHGPSDAVADDHDIDASLDLLGVPEDLTVHLTEPVVGEDPGDNVPMRILTTASPPPADFDAELSFENRKAGADCDEPDPAGDVQCIRATVDDLPEHVSIVAGETADGVAAHAWACDRDLDDESCNGVADGDPLPEIGAIETWLRMVTGSPDGVRPFVEEEFPLPASDPDPYLLEFRMDQPSDVDRELVASGRIEHISGVSFAQSDQGFDILTRLGDGETPLLSHVELDTRTLPDEEGDTEGVLVVGDARVADLPDFIRIVQEGPAGEDEPMAFHYESSEGPNGPVDIDALGKVFQAAAADDAACGDRGTFCASLDLERLPASLDAELVQSESQHPDIADRAFTDMTLALDALPHPGQDKPDLLIEAILGEGLLALPELLGKDVPLVVFADLEGFPRRTRMSLRGYEDFGLVPDPDNEGAFVRESIDETVERFEIHACDRDFGSGECRPDDDDPTLDADNYGQIDRLTAGFRNFHLRPAGFPPPTEGITAPNYATVVGRGTAFEAEVQLVEIKEVQYVHRETDGVIGVRSQIGGGGELLARADIEDLDLGDVSILDADVDDATLDAFVEARVVTLPEDLTVCFRTGGNGPLVAPSDDFTRPCENVNPFDGDPSEDDTSDPLASAPISLAYRSLPPVPFDVFTRARATIEGTDAATGDPIRSRNLAGRLDVQDVPGELTVHALTPSDGAGTQRGDMNLFVDAPAAPAGDAPGPGGVTVDFEASYTLGDSICRDPRAEIGVEAYCAAGTLRHLPERFEMQFAPDERFDNLSVTTQGAGKMDFDDLSLSYVRPVLDDEGDVEVDNGVPQADVLIVDGAILGIDKAITVDGSLALPKGEGQAPFIDLTADISIDSIDAEIRNFVAPDPIGAVPPKRSSSVVPGAVDQVATFQQRGKFFKATAHIEDVRGVGFRTVGSTNDDTAVPLDTKALNVQFGENQSLRAYVDIADDADDPAKRVVADAMLGEIPAGLEICFRGAKTTSLAPAAGQGTFCDDIDPETGLPLDLVEDDEGAIQLVGTPAEGTSAELDVDAFFRMASGGGADIIAARAEITNIPNVVQGTIPAGTDDPASSGGDLDIRAFNLDGTEAGIDQIRFNVASFDLGDGDTGWTAAQLPYAPFLVDNDTFPAEVPDAESGPAGTPTDNQYLTAAFGNGMFHARGLIGEPGTSAASRLHRVRFGKESCPRPESVSASAYPHYPAGRYESGGDQDIEYMCIGAAFKEHNGIDPLDLRVLGALESGENIEVTEAGLTNVPEWLQVGIAKAPATELDPEFAGGTELEQALATTMRRPCRSEAEEGENADCVPPLIRFDQPDNPGQTKLFAKVAFGTKDRIGDLADIEPHGGAAMVDLDQAPKSDGSGWNDAWADEPLGVRAKVGVFDPVSTADTATLALRLGIRLGVPQSLTVDTPASWELPEPLEVKEEGMSIADFREQWIKGSDIRFRYVVRDAAGNPVGRLGQAAALVDLEDSGLQILAHAACDIETDVINILENIPSSQLFTGAIDSDTIDDVIDNVAPARLEQQCAGDGHHTDGFPIPGEFGINLNIREDVGEARQFFQIDGRASDPGEPLSLGARMLFKEGKIGVVDTQVLDVPTTAGLTSPAAEEDATFRLRMELGGERVEDDAIPVPEAPPEPSPGSFFHSLCDDIICFDAKVFVPHIFAAVDFKPTGEAFARRVDLAVSLAGKVNQGIELAGYDAIVGGNEVPIGLAASIEVDPLDLKMRDNFGKFFSDLGDDAADWAVDNLGIIGDLVGWAIRVVFDAVATFINEVVQLNLDMRSDLDVQVNMPATRHLTLEHSLLHVEVQNGGPQPAWIGPIDLHVDEFQAIANVGFTVPLPWPLPDVPIGFTLLNAWYVPGTPFIPLDLDFIECSAGGIIGTPIVDRLAGPVAGLDQLFFPNIIEVPPGASDGDPERNFILYPLDDLRILWGGILGPVIQTDFVKHVVAPFFCFVGHDDLKLFSAGRPGDPLALADHPVNFTSLFVPPAEPGPAPNTAPTADITSPSSNTSVSGNPVTVAVDATDVQDGAGSLAVEVEVTPGGGGAAVASGTATWNGSNRYEFDFDSTALANGTYLVSATSTDDGMLSSTPDTIQIQVSNVTPEPPPVLDLASLGTDIALCGSHSFSEIIVPAGFTLSVATAPDSSPVVPGLIEGPRCPATTPNPADPGGPAIDATGHLLLQATNVTIEGTVDADAINDVSLADNPPGDNSGAGHGGAGGDGSQAGAPGLPFGDTTTAVVTEPGEPAAEHSVAGGRGGGDLVINAIDTMTIGGTITANGDSGVDHYVDGECGTPAVPGDPPEPAVPSTGSHGGGGGSGGGVALAATVLDLRGGQVFAEGGDAGPGKLGYGGGAGGGIVKLSAPVLLRDGSSGPHVAGGDGGPAVGDPTCWDTESGDPGAPGAVVLATAPRSILTEPEAFEPYRGADLEPTFDARAALDSAKGFNVVLCGVHEAAGTSLPAGVSDPSVAAFADTLFNSVTTLTNSAVDPCGPGEPLASTHIPDAHTLLAPDAAAVLESGLTEQSDNGWWGLYTIVVRPGAGLPANHDCVADPMGCDVETIDARPEASAPPAGYVPGSILPDRIYLVDNRAPAVDVSAVAVDPDATVVSGVIHTKVGTVNLTVAANDLDLNAPGTASSQLSGLEAVQCRNENTSEFLPCQPGTFPWNTSDGEGTKTITVRAVDKAGNFTDVSVQVEVDQTADPVSGVISAPDGDAGWYITSPGIVVAQDPGTTASSFRYRFNQGSERACSAPVLCPVPSSEVDALVTATHTFHFTGVDPAGNRWFDDNDPATPGPMFDELDVAGGGTTTAIPIDRDDPLSELLTVPAAPDQLIGADPWFSTRPFLVLSAIDPFGGSGLPASAISYSLNGGPPQPYTGPIHDELVPGANTITWTVTDVAGRSVSFGPETVRFDDDAPTASFDAAPAAPDGANGWYVSDPTLTVSGYTDGAGVGAPLFVSGLQTRVDNESRVDHLSDPAVVGSFLDGEHRFSWQAVDRFGNTRPETALRPLGSFRFDVDLTDPRSYLQPGPAAADGSNGWYVQKPWITLAAADALVDRGLRPPGSGIDRIEYDLGAGPVTYTGPFELGAGTHQVCHWAVDVAGRSSDRVCEQLQVDLASPVTDVLDNGTVTPSNDGDNGWYVLDPVVITQSTTDPVPGSGVVQSFSSDLCDHIGDDDPAPAGVCISVDGRAPGAPMGGPEFGPYSGAIHLGEGEHTIRAFSVDRAGQRSAMAHRQLSVDRSDPVSVARLRAPQASRDGLVRPWWRHEPTLVLRGVDGDQNAGVRRIEYRVGGGAVETYSGPITIPRGVHTVEHRAVDESGRVGPFRSVGVAVDLTPPEVEALSPNPAVLTQVKLLGVTVWDGPDTADLHWQVSDDLSGPIRVRVIVYDETGFAVRHLDGGVHHAVPGSTLHGSTKWDGRDDGLIGFVGAGVYYYRVVAVDDAGNVAMSGESDRLLIKLKVNLLGGLL